MYIGHQLALITLILGKLHLAACLTNLTSLLLPEDALLNFTQLADKYGHRAEVYHVTTRDGYVLAMFRIPGVRDPNRPPETFPVLLMHGVLDSADIWILRGNNSLGLTLANAGYDVWFGNVRGNRYSRRHVRLDPDRDRAFWDFSFDDHGRSDLPSFIDLVLRTTGAPRLNAIGHSQGNSIFYVMGSTRPEYNAKVNSLTALGPIAFLDHVGKPLAGLVRLAPALYRSATALGIDEIPGRVVGEYIRWACSPPVVGYAKCALGAFFPLVGFDVRELEPPFFRHLVGHLPAGTSAKNLFHFAQVARSGKYARFDYGPERNVEEYGSAEPPAYELGLVTTPVALLVAANDRIADPEDAERLSRRLPRVVELALLPRRRANHADFVVGRTMNDYLWPQILRILNRFR